MSYSLYEPSVLPAYASDDNEKLSTWIYSVRRTAESHRAAASEERTASSASIRGIQNVQLSLGDNGGSDSGVISLTTRGVNNVGQIGPKRKRKKCSVGGLY